MSLLQNIKSFWRGESLENPNTPLNSTNLVNDLASSTKAGQLLDFQRAIELSGVYVCLRILGESLAASRPRLFQRTGGGAREAFEHPHYQLMVNSPSPLYSPFSFYENMTVAAAGPGNGIANIVWGDNGYAKEIRIIDPSIVNPVIVKDRLFYKISTGNTAYSSEDILHIPSMTKDGIWGISPIKANRESITAGLRQNEYMGGLMENGAFLQGYFKIPLAISSDAKKNLQKDLRTKFSGAENGKKTIILEDGMEYVPLKLSPADLNWIANQRWTLEDTCRVFRIPLHLAQELSRSTNNNIETQDLGFIKHTLRPWCERWEDELDRKLLTEDERREGFFWRCNLDNFLRGDSKARAEYYSKLFAIGVLSQNDIRKMENLNAIPGGDRYFVPLNMVDISELENLNPDERQKVAQQYREKILS